MDVTSIIAVIFALTAGLTAGALVSRRSAERRLAALSAEAAVLRATLDGERAAAGQREELLLRSADVAGLLRPLSDSLTRVGQQLSEVEKGRVSSDTAIREQVQAMTTASQFLSTQAAQLVTALRAPQIRGRWGEMQLKRTVEAAGMTEHVDFDTQVSTATGDGAAVRPDMVVHLPGGKHVVVDAKVACIAYLEAMEAADESRQQDRLTAHARQVRGHVDALSDKRYWAHFEPTPDFVVCFLPADVFLDAALRHDPSLLDHAFAANVVLATPSTLVALLRTIGYTWRQEALASNARQVHELARDLYRRLATMGGHVDRLGRALGSAVGAYNDTIGSLEHTVLAKARQLGALGVVGPDAQLRELRPVTTAVRPVAAPELLASAGEAVASISPHPAFPGSVLRNLPYSGSDARADDG